MRYNVHLLTNAVRFLMAKLLLFTLTSLSLIGFCHFAAADTHPGTKLWKCDSGTAWDEVAPGNCPLTSPPLNTEPMLKHTWANRRVVTSRKKPRRMQAKQRTKLWARKSIVFLLLLLLLSGDIETNPGPTTDKQNLLSEENSQDKQNLLSEENPQDMMVEQLSGFPLYPIPLSVMDEELESGAHLVYQVSGEPHRPCYRSALVLKVEDTRIHVITNSKDGVQKVWLNSSNNLYVVKYSHCRYTSDEAVERAKQRLKWGETCYHCLNNNSHHFVTWAKTGRENSLADITESLTYKKDNYLAPVLTKVTIHDLNDLNEGDHIMTGTQHYLVAGTDTEHDTYTGYTCKRGIVVKEGCTLNPLSTIRIDYDESFSSREAIRNAEEELERGEWFDKSDSSDKFVTKMKTGKRYSFNEQRLFMEKIQLSYTKILPGIAIDEGDHLMIKDENGNYQSVLVLKHAGGNTLIVTPGISSEALEQCGTLYMDESTEVYRINYTQSLPVDEVFKRVNSDKGFQVLSDCRMELSKFVSWAKTGRKELINTTKMKFQIAQMCPFQREKVLSVDQIQVGDHLIQSYPTHWWHFMITETYPSHPSSFKTIYCLRTRIVETMETLNPSKKDIYRIVYPESLPVETSIQRARSKCSIRNYSPLGRMWFIRWAKTGSEDGIEVDFLVNNAMPASKSCICTFAQLNPGDYLVEEDKTTPWHHYLVTEVTSPSSCSAIESWNWKVTSRNLTLKDKSRYYRLNYNDGACISPEQVIIDAHKLLGKRIITPEQYKYKRQKLVNYLKTHNDTEVTIDAFQNDRILLHRERVESALDLRPGDHIERPTSFIKALYHHMMVTEIPGNDHFCKVIHFGKPSSLKITVQEEEVDIFQEGENVFRIKYPERCEPDQGIVLLRELVESHPKYALRKNNCEHLIMEATVGERLSIQVTEIQHKALQRTTAALIVAGVSLGHAHAANVANVCTSVAAKGVAHVCVKAAAKSGVKAGVKATAKAGAKATAKAAAKAGGKLTAKVTTYASGDAVASSAETLFQLGFRAALSGTAIGIVAGVAVAVNLLIEVPLLARSVYKLHRKKKFDQISSEEYKRGIVKESVTSANTVVGAVGGAIVGQVAIPVPVLGAAVGGAVGGIVGQACGRAEGWAVGKLVRDPKSVTMLPLTTLSFLDNPPPINCEEQ